MEYLSHLEWLFLVEGTRDTTVRERTFPVTRTMWSKVSDQEGTAHVVNGDGPQLMHLRKNRSKAWTSDLEMHKAGIFVKPRNVLLWVISTLQTEAAAGSCHLGLPSTPTAR